MCNIFNEDINYKNSAVYTDEYEHRSLLARKLKELQTNEISISVILSKKTLSVYGLASFSRHSHVMMFGIKAHESSDNALTVSYRYKDHEGIDELVKRISIDLNLALTKKFFCTSTKLSMVDFDFLNYLVESNSRLIVSSEPRRGTFKIVEVRPNSNSTEEENDKLVDKPFINSMLAQNLLDRMLLRDVNNRKPVEELVVSSLGKLSVMRGKRVFEVSHNF